MLFYLIRADTGELSVTPIVQADRPFSAHEMLSPGLPFNLAQGLSEILKAEQSKAERSKAQQSENEKKEILKCLRKHSDLRTLDWRWVRLPLAEGKLESAKVNTVNEVNERNERNKRNERNFTSRIQGRQLSEADLQRLANEMGLNLKEVIQLCQLSVLKGQAQWLPAVKKEKQGWRCMRCGETKIEEWPSIYGLAGTCPSCAALGALSSLQVLYRTLEPCPNGGRSETNGRPEVNREPICFAPHWALSQAQEKASREVLTFVSGETSRKLLLWAACGAGKTEVCFPAAARALERGLKVLFAAPRQDVVLDVAPRLKRDFPGLDISVLTGVSPQRFTPASLVLATTHQVLRFYHAFDLIFMDEVDAFPYYGDEALAWGLQQALKPEGKMVYLTATPSPENIAAIQSKEMELVRLPARHHRKPLPIPEWIKASVSDGNDGPDGLDQWIKSLAQCGPVLIFVPKISWVNVYVKRLRAVFPEWIIEGSYSSDPGRRGKIEKLRTGEYSVFVTTSILERGVTVPDAQVIVLAADHDVFDERALVQMAGRVGRTRENPQGRALFLARRKTPAIQKAIDWIREQNNLALEQGLIE